MVLYLILALVAIGLVCMVIIMVKVFSKEETTAVSAKDFDRLEGRVSDENRKARQELSDKIEILELSRESLDVHDPSSKFSAQSSKTKVYNVNNGYLMACFDKDVNETTITEIARQHPYYFVLRDSSLATDNVADNFEQIWEEYSKETVRKII